MKFAVVKTIAAAAAVCTAGASAYDAETAASASTAETAASRSAAGFLAAFPPVAAGGANGFELHKITTPATAACLDGSAPGVYLEANARERFASSRGLVIFLQGGGWVASPEDAVQRSKTRLGSSASWPAAIGALHGPLSSNATENAEFHDFVHAYVPYCDGASFAGAVDGTVPVQGTDLHVRGFDNLRGAVDLIRTVVGEGGATPATRVVLTGSSAGGLATFLHADTIAAWFPLARTIAVPQSGFFLDFPTIQGKPFYKDWMTWVFGWSNARVGVNQACLAALNDERCFFAEFSLAFTTTPVYMLQSRFDAWQMSNVLKLSSGCVHGGPSACSAAEIAYANEFSAAIVSKIESLINGDAGRALAPPGIDSAFVTACWTHATFQSVQGFNGVTVNGTNAERALAAWKGHGGAFILDCDRDTAGQPTCNPTCAK
jgi:hypothetical protein